MPTSKRSDRVMTSRHPPETLHLDTPHVPLAALHWPAPGGPRMLALHGWLDNAASFVPLAAHLDGLDLVALDLPGHGHSGHRPAAAPYYFTEYLFDVDRALDALGWDNCHLLGHSMGAAVAALFAAAAPERVLSVTLLDGLGPLPAPPEATADRLAKSLASRRDPPRRRRRYDSIEAMVAARLANSGNLDADAARLICERAARRVGDHYEWRTDPALYWVSPILMTEEQALDCLRHIKAPLLSLTALPYARWADEAQLRRRTAAIPHGVHETLEGHHHFHMDQADRTAARILRFIGELQDRP